MKRIDSIIRPEKLSEMRRLLSEIGIVEVVVAEITAFGRKMSRTIVYGGMNYSVRFGPMLLLTVVVPEEQAQRVVVTIAGSGWAADIEDGTIIVTPVVDVLQIGTGTR